jgi:hypothetical protein
VKNMRVFAVTLLSLCLPGIVSVSLAQTQVAGSGQKSIGAVGRNCTNNSKCAPSIELKAVLPLDSEVDENKIVYSSNVLGTFKPTGIGDYPDYAAMYGAVPIIDFDHKTLTYQARFFNRSSNLPRIASIEVPYTTPRKTKTFRTSSGYIAIPPVGRNCKDDSCATRQIVRAFVPNNAVGVNFQYLTTAANPQGKDDDTPLHPVAAGPLDWGTFTVETPNTTLSKSLTAYESTFLNRSSDRTRYAVLVVTYSLP